VSLLTRRSQLLSGLMLGLLSLPAVAAELPRDVPADAWAATAVSAMVDKWQILGLSPEGRFDGHAEVSRYETAETFWRVLRLVERRQSVDLTARSGDPTAFGDVEAQHEDAVDAVVNAYALMEGFPGGATGGRFYGHRGTTRYELAWMLHRLMIRSEAKKVAVTGRGPSLTYTDIPQGHWSGTILHDLTQKFGLLIGFPDFTYRGDKALSRYEMAIAMNACLANLLDKQLAPAAVVAPKPTPKPAKPAAVTTPAMKPLPGFDSDYMVHVGRHAGRDLAAGLMVDMTWWLGKVGPTRPGLGLNADYSLLLNQNTPLAQSALANAELRWRLIGSDFADQPYLYLSGGYHMDLWHGAVATVPMLIGHGVGSGVAAGIPLGPWDLWLTGKYNANFFMFPDMSISRRLSNGQQYSVALEKRWGTNALRLGYYGTSYLTFPTEGSGTFLPAGQTAGMLSGHFAF
jgi:hypothetical protein